DLDDQEAGPPPVLAEEVDRRDAEGAELVPPAGLQANGLAAAGIELLEGDAVDVDEAVFGIRIVVLEGLAPEPAALEQGIDGDLVVAMSNGQVEGRVAQALPLSSRLRVDDHGTSKDRGDRRGATAALVGNSWPFSGMPTCAQKRVLVQIIPRPL